MPQFSAPQLLYTDDKVRKKRVWYVAFMYKNELTGKREQFQFRGTINKENSEESKIFEGRSYCVALQNILNSGWNPFEQTPGEYIRAQHSGFVSRPKNLLECLEECYEIKKKQLTGNESIRTYKYIFEHFKKWIVGQFLDQTKPYNFTVAHAMAYSDQLIREGKSGRGFNNYRSVIKVFFNMMLERELIVKNPFTKIKPAKITEAEIVPFQDMELKIIRDHLKENDYNLYVFCQFIFYTLARPIEIIKLQVKHIDLSRNKINIPAAASKNRKSRPCNIPPALKSILNEWLKFTSVNDYLFGRGLQVSPLPCMTRNQVTVRHKDVLKALKFEGKISLYSWKYSGVINAYLAGISIEEIRAQAGHHSIEITQIYMAKLGLLKASGFGTVEY